MRPFPRSLLAGDVLDAAAAILGARLVREVAGQAVRVGRIVEVEAYGGTEDRASHARAGLTRRTAVMFGAPGLAYVYLVYGMYDCLNVASGPEGEPAAVLIRAIEPIEGIEEMRVARAAALRARGRTAVRPIADELIATGPGRLCDALSVGRPEHGRDLLDPAGDLRLECPAPADRPPEPAWSARIGVARAGQPWATVPWRLVDRTSRSVSTPS